MVSELRNVQLIELTTLKAVKAVCEKHKITYYLSGGTLLGAVRHQGFIPWDDDIDIMMPYESYQKFLRVAQSELGTEYFVQTYITDPHFHFSFTRIRRTCSAMVPVAHRRWKINHGIWLDIFPLIPIKGNHDYIIKKKLVTLSNFFQMDSFILDNEEEFKALLRGGYIFFRVFLQLPLKIRINLHKCVENYLQKCKFTTYFSEQWGSLTNKYDVGLLQGETVYLQFEDDTFPVLPGYIQYLRDTYGDYMKLPPPEERKGHGCLIISLNEQFVPEL